MNVLTQSVTVDRRAHLLRFGALIAAALCSRSQPSPPAPERRSRTRRSCSCTAHSHRLPDGARWPTRCTRTATRRRRRRSAWLLWPSDVAIVRSTLDSIPGDKILVGHSYGGFVITNAASGRTDVRGLVYTAAYVPDSGETINSLSVGFTPGAFLAHLVLGPVVPLLHRRPAVLPRGLRPGLESEAGRRDRSRAAPNEPGPLRHSIRARRLAHAPVVVRSLGPRPRHRPCPAAVHGPARWIDDRRVLRREPRGRPHPLQGALREADRTSE